MNKAAANVTYLGVEPKQFRRFPWMTADDVVLLQSLAPAAAREMENLILSQARSDTEFRRQIGQADDLTMERASARSTSSLYGTGGGRVRRVPEP